MGKTHEALQRAEKEFQENFQEANHDSQRALALKWPKPFPMPAPFDGFQQVQTKLITSFPTGLIKTILITSTAHGVGSTHSAVSFATNLASCCRLDILLIDANFRSPRIHEVFKIEPNQGLVNLMIGKEEKRLFFQKAGHGNLYVIACGKNRSRSLNLFETGRFDKTLKLMREKFDYVILDAPPVNRYTESKVMATKADGVILVLESGKTRRQVAIRAKQELEEAGAKILGVILNRRKHYIPEWIYKRL
jgi:capsular exopolysaccharide synthesis family protein